MLKRFLVAFRMVVFCALFGAWSNRADAQIQNGSVFNSQGPGPETGPSAIIQGNDNPPKGSAAGAIQAIAVDPSRAGTIYAGAANGGIWKTTNGGINWGPLIDQKASLSIASLTLDPTDPTHQTLVAGTGLTSNGGFASTSVSGTPADYGGLQDGLLYSRNGGTTWTSPGATTLSGQSVVGVAALGTTILAATFEPRIIEALKTTFTGGLYRSINSGASFAAVSGAPGSGLPAGPVSSLVSNPDNPNILYAALTANSDSIKNLAQTSVYVSGNAGATWQPVFTGASSGRLISLASSQMHQTFIRIAAGPNDTLALGLVDAQVGRLIGLFYSNNAGVNWRQLTPPTVNAGGQAGVNLALAIDPGNSNLVYVMGDNVGNEDNKLDNALAIFRVNAASNTLARISDDNNATGFTGNGSWVHPDGRALVFDGGRLLTSTDSGLYVRTNPESSAGVWQGLNGNLSVMELYAIAYDANSKRLVVATQDNGESYQSAPGAHGFNAIGVGGDGTNAVVNDVTLGSQSAIYVSAAGSAQGLPLERLIVDATGAIKSPLSPLQGPNALEENGVPVEFNIPVAGAYFLSPFVLNNIDKTRIAVGGTAVYVTQDTLSGANGPGATQVNLSLTKLGDTNNRISSIDYGTRNNPSALLAGGGTTDNPNGALYLSTNAAAGSLRNLPRYSGLAPTSVKFDLRSDQRFFVADSVQLYGSVNQGASFQTLTGNLPANFIRPTSLAFIDAEGVDALLVGGLNNAENAGNPLAVADSDAKGDLSGWRRLGSGLPNAMIFALSYNEKSDTLAVGTIGRGAYLLYDVTSNFASASVLQFGLADNNSNPDPAILFGNRPLIKYGSGTLTINGASTYSGGTLIEAGTLVAGTNNPAQTTSFALGTGNVFLEGGTLRTPSLDPLVINVANNFTQGAGGTLALGVAGVAGKEYDRMQVQGNAGLNGTLELSSLNNFQPSSGNGFEVLLAKGLRSGGFAQVSDSLNNNPNLAQVVLYAPNGVALIYVSSTPRSPITDVTSVPLPPVNPDGPLPVPVIISLLNPTAEQLTSLYEISFSGANTQRLNLEERLAEIQGGSTGFVSNLNLHAPPTPYEGKNSLSTEEQSGKSAVERPQVLQPTPENRWGIWVTGWGDFVNVGDDNFAKGYDFTTGGVTIGSDYRLTDHFAIGLFGSYAHSWTNLQPGNVDVNSGRAGLYATYFGRGFEAGTFYLNAAIFGGYNSYDTSRQGLAGSATGNTDGAEFSTLIGAGYDFNFGNLTFGPLASLQYTYASFNSFNEQGSLVPLAIHSDSQDSLRTDFGLRASYNWRIGSIMATPSVTAAWEHEYEYSSLPLTVSAPVFGGASATLFGPSEGHDSAIVTAGVGVQWTPRISTYVSYQGQLGRDRYDSNGVSGGASLSF